MNNAAAGRRSVFVLLLILALAAVAAAGPFLGGNLIRADHWELVSQLSELKIGQGHFFRSRFAPMDDAKRGKVLIQAQLAVLSTPDSPLRSRLQAFIAAADGKLETAAELLKKRAD